MASTPHIYTNIGGPNAFTKDNQLVMFSGAPVVGWSFDLKKLEQWITTVEEIIPDLPAHRSVLHDLLCSLQAAHLKHEEQHEQIVTEAPSGDDLMEYLASYAAAIGGQG